MHVQLLGINHRTAPIELREALAMDGAAAGESLRSLRGDPAIAESAILATCNRTEIYACGPDPEQAERALRRVFAEHAGASSPSVDAHAYWRIEEDAIRHLLEVAAGLDSMILGEHQVLGQVRHALALAREAESIGPVMHRLFSAAIHAGKRARTETDIGMGAVSVASAAISLVEQTIGDLRGRSVVVVGAGDTGRLAAQHFAGRRPARLVVANRSPARAAAVAEAFGGEPIALHALAAALADADAVVSATRAPGFVITAEMARSAMIGRGGARPLVLVDLAVPRDIDPAGGSVPGVVLHPIDAVQNMVDRSLAHRLSERPRAEAIVDEECRKVAGWLANLGTISVVRELSEHFEKVRLEEMRRRAARFSPEQAAEVDHLTKSLLARLLREPITRLTSGELSHDAEAAQLELIRVLFALDGSRSAAATPHGAS